MIPKFIQLLKNIPEEIDYDDNFLKLNHIGCTFGNRVMYIHNQELLIKFVVTNSKIIIDTDQYEFEYSKELLDENFDDQVYISLKYHKNVFQMDELIRNTLKVSEQEYDEFTSKLLDKFKTKKHLHTGS